MNRRAKGRDVHGILLLDKPTGFTSNAALQIVKRLYQARKAGHTGSLDPLASGLLPLCLGEATKVSGFLLEADKHYRAVCKLGVTTTTADAQGEVCETRPTHGITRAQVERVLAEFSGPIEQIPPMHSALKQQGQPLYKLAHRGISVERAARSVVIHALTLVNHHDDLVELDVQCSKGTYIRTLAEDIGARLGCGAHLAALRRTGVGQFTEAQALTLDSLHEFAQRGPEHLDSLLMPMHKALAHWPGVSLSEAAAFYLSQGQSVFVPHSPAPGWVRLFAGEQRFIGIGQVLEDGRVAPKRLLSGL